MHLDPRSIPYRVAERLIRLALPLVVLASGSTFGLGPGVASLAVVGGVLAVIGWEIAVYRQFSYTVTDDTLDIHSGVLSRRERAIPLGRIQNVDTSRNVLQRALGIVDVRIETAGGTSTEARLRYLSTEAAHGLRVDVREGRTNESEPAVDGETSLFEISSRELLLLGLVSIDLRVLSLVTILLPLVGLPIAMGTPDAAPIPLGPAGAVSLAPVSALGVVVLSGIARGVFAATNYYAFRLWRAGADLRYERGLLQRSEGTIPTGKIQALAIEEPLLARLTGHATLAVETAGYAPGSGPSGGSEAAVPLATRKRCLALARSLEPVAIPSFERPPKRARTRYLGRYAGATIALSALGWALARFLSIALPRSVLFVPLAVLLLVVPLGAHLKWANLGYALADGYVLTRAGFWTRTTAIVPDYRVQTIAVSATVFQRRRSLATLTVDTAGANGSRVARALDIDGREAAALQATIGDRLTAALTARRSIRARSRVAGPVEPAIDDRSAGIHPLVYDLAVPDRSPTDTDSRPNPDPGTGHDDS